MTISKIISNIIAYIRKLWQRGPELASQKVSYIAWFLRSVKWLYSKLTQWFENIGKALFRRGVIMWDFVDQEARSLVADVGACMAFVGTIAFFARDSMAVAAKSASNYFTRSFFPANVLYMNALKDVLMSEIIIATRRRLVEFSYPESKISAKMGITFSKYTTMKIDDALAAQRPSKTMEKDGRISSQQASEAMVQLEQKQCELISSFNEEMSPIEEEYRLVTEMDKINSQSTYSIFSPKNSSNILEISREDILERLLPHDLEMILETMTHLRQSFGSKPNKEIVTTEDYNLFSMEGITIKFINFHLQRSDFLFDAYTLSNDEVRLKIRALCRYWDTVHYGPHEDRDCYNALSEKTSKNQSIALGAMGDARRDADLLQRVVNEGGFKL